MWSHVACDVGLFPIFPASFRGDARFVKASIVPFSDFRHMVLERCTFFFFPFFLYLVFFFFLRLFT